MWREICIVGCIESWSCRKRVRDLWKSWGEASTEDEGTSVDFANCRFLRPHTPLHLYTTTTTQLYISQALPHTTPPHHIPLHLFQLLSKSPSSTFVAASPSLSWPRCRRTVTGFTKLTSPHSPPPQPPPQPPQSPAQPSPLAAQPSWQFSLWRRLLLNCLKQCPPSYTTLPCVPFSPLPILSIASNFHNIHKHPFLSSLTSQRNIIFQSANVKYGRNWL